MKPPLMLTRDIIGIGEFKAHASAYIRRLRKTPGPLVITQHGRPAAVIMSPAEYDQSGYDQYFRAKVEEGLADLRAGRTMSTAQVRRHLAKRRRARANAR
jgi:prevent-host-death family protein